MTLKFFCELVTKNMSPVVIKFSHQHFVCFDDKQISITFYRYNGRHVWSAAATDCYHSITRCYELADKCDDFFLKTNRRIKAAICVYSLLVRVGWSATTYRTKNTMLPGYSTATYVAIPSKLSRHVGRKWETSRQFEIVENYQCCRRYISPVQFVHRFSCSFVLTPG